MTHKCIERTATLAWAPSIRRNGAAFPLYFAVGSVAGALDASFSSRSELEIFAYPSSEVDFSSKTIARLAGAPSSARFNRISWSPFSSEDRPIGIIAAGLENGELVLYNPQKMISGSTEDPVFVRSTTHTSAVRGVEFNSIQPNLLGTAAGQGEILIWDLNRPSAPYSPGATKTHRLAGAELQHLSWNRSVPHILAVSSSNGVAVVWDVRNCREVFTINAPSGQQNSGPWNTSGASRQGVVGAWHPDEPLRFLTAMEDDANPFIYMWDLRNAHAPLNILHGHSRGILSVSWCQKDSDVLISCGMDNRIICWDASSGSIISELPHANNWCFDTQFCLRNPSLVSVASYDGTITFHNLTGDDRQVTQGQEISESDPFSQINNTDLTKKSEAHVFLKKPPKWLSRPCSVAFGFGGKIITFSQKSKQCHIKVVGSSLFDDINKLNSAVKNQTIGELALERVEAETKFEKKIEWLVIRALFCGESGRKILQEKLKEMNSKKIPDNILDKFIEKDQELYKNEIEAEMKKLSLYNIPDKATEININEININNDESLENNQKLNDKSIILNNEEEKEESIENNGKYDEVTKTLIYGGFEKAVQVCLKKKNYTDALILAACSGKESFVKVRDEFLSNNLNSWYPFVSMITSENYNKIFKLGLTWSEILSTLLTYCPSVQLVEMSDKLGSMLNLANEKFGATICYLLGANIEQLVKIWSYDLDEAFLLSPIQKVKLRWGPKYSESSSLLQNLVEKVTMIMRAISVEQFPDSMAEHFIEYSEIMAQNGHMDVSWTYIAGAMKLLENPEKDYALFDKRKSKQSFLVIKDRVYHAMTKAQLKNLSINDLKIESPFKRIIVAEPPPPQVIPPQVSQVYSRGPNAPIQRPPSGQQQPQYASRPAFNENNVTRYPGPSFSREQQNRPTGGNNNIYNVPPTFSQMPSSTQTNLQRPYPTPTNAYSQQDPNYTMQPQPYDPQRNYAPPKMIVSPPPQMKSPEANVPFSQNGRIVSNAPPMGPAIQFSGQFATNSSSAAPSHHVAAPVGGSSNAARGWNDAPIVPTVKRAIVNPQAQHIGQFQQHGMDSTMPPQQRPAPSNYQTVSQNAVEGYYQAPQSSQESYGVQSQAVGSFHQQPSSKSPQQSNQVSPIKAPQVEKEAPSGDRSLIPIEHRPIYQGLQSALELLRTSSTQQQPRVLEDVEKRMNALFDELNRKTVTPSEIVELQRYLQAIQARDYMEARRVQLELSRTSFKPWMIGLKRLIDLLLN